MLKIRYCKRAVRLRNRYSQRLSVRSSLFTSTERFERFSTTCPTFWSRPQWSKENSPSNSRTLFGSRSIARMRTFEIPTINRNFFANALSITIILSSLLTAPGRWLVIKRVTASVRFLSDTTRQLVHTSITDSHDNVRTPKTYDCRASERARRKRIEPVGCFTLRLDLDAGRTDVIFRPFVSYAETANRIEKTIVKLFGYVVMDARAVDTDRIGSYFQTRRCPSYAVTSRQRRIKHDIQWRSYGMIAPRGPEGALEFASYFSFEDPRKQVKG